MEDTPPPRGPLAPPSPFPLTEGGRKRRRSKKAKGKKRKSSKRVKSRKVGKKSRKRRR